VLGATHTTRKPILLLRFSRELLLRYAERQLLGLLAHEPPLLIARPSFTVISYRLTVNSLLIKLTGLPIAVMILPPYPNSGGEIQETKYNNLS
jgi:hypothetical protein